MELGYESYEEPLKIPLAVEGRYADLVGQTTCFLEIAGHRLPIGETLGVIRGLRVDAIVGLDVIEPYEIALEKDRVVLKKVPPMPHLI